MHDLPKTRNSLLVRVQQRDQDAWDEFSKIYRPLIYRIARRRGWQDADAQDVSQKVLLKVAAAIPNFRPSQSRARFRTWLTTICNNTLVDELRRTRPDSAIGGITSHEITAECAAVDVSEAELTLEHRRQVFRWAAAGAAETFAESTWQAFWQTAVEGKSAGQVAEEFEISVGAVYTARSRVMQFMKQRVQDYNDAEV